MKNPTLAENLDAYILQAGHYEDKEVSIPFDLAKKISEALRPTAQSAVSDDEQTEAAELLNRLDAATHRKTADTARIDRVLLTELKAFLRSIQASRQPVVSNRSQADREIMATFCDVQADSWGDDKNADWYRAIAKELRATRLRASMAMVPRNPTMAMLAAGQAAWVKDDLKRTTTLWAAMVEAAERQAALDELASESERLGLYDAPRDTPVSGE